MIHEASPETTSDVVASVAAELMISDLQREPRRVLEHIEHIEHDDVILRRRGAPSLRLTIEGRDAARDSTSVGPSPRSWRGPVATAELETSAPIAQLVTEWRAIAEAWADPDLAARLTAPIGRTAGTFLPKPA